MNMTNMSGDSSVSIVTGYRFDARISIRTRAGQYWGPPSLVSFGCRGVEQGTGLTKSRADVSNVGNYTPLPHTSCG